MVLVTGKIAKLQGLHGIIILHDYTIANIVLTLLTCIIELMHNVYLDTSYVLKGSSVKLLLLTTTMKDYIEAAVALLTFKPYTVYDRWFEIGLGINAWLSIIIIVATIITWL